MRLIMNIVGIFLLGYATIIDILDDKWLVATVPILGILMNIKWLIRDFKKGGNND